MTIVDLGRTRDENDRLIQLAMVCMCTGILAADVLMPLGFVIWILYLIPLLMSVWLSYRYSPFFTAWVVSGAILIGSLMAAHVDPSDLPNRAIFILITAIIALLIREILAITGTTIVETGEPGKGARFEITWPVGQYRILPAAS
jgi:hypothetical protein